MDNPVGEAEAGPTLRLPAIFTRLIQSYLLFYLWILVLLLPHDSYAYVIQMIINVIYNWEKDLFNSMTIDCVTESTS
jgi:Na+/H+ antiporter NhaC